MVNTKLRNKLNAGIERLQKNNITPITQNTVGQAIASPLFFYGNESPKRGLIKTLKEVNASAKAAGINPINDRIYNMILDDLNDTGRLNVRGEYDFIKKHALKTLKKGVDLGYITQDEFDELSKLSGKSFRKKLKGFSDIYDKNMNSWTSKESYYSNLYAALLG